MKAISVDIGGTKLCVACVNQHGRIEKSKFSLTEPERNWQRIAQNIVQHINAVLPRSVAARKDICGIGIGCPGTLSRDKTQVILAPNLGWNNVPLQHYIAERVAYPVFLENDTNLGVLGVARYGEAKNARNVVGMFVGTGIGGGIIINGQLYDGYNGTAAEIGHMIVQIDGPMGPTGTRGCWEQIVSRPAIMRDIETYFQGRGRGTSAALYYNKSANKARALRVLCEKKDKAILEIVHYAGRVLGLGMANIMNILNPQMIVIGGGIIEDIGAYLLPIAKKVAKESAITGSARGVKIVETQLKNDAVLLGAAAIAFDRFDEKS